MENNEEFKLDEKVVKEIEKDLKCYPDWTIRISMPGLGSPSKYGIEVQKSICFDSYIEKDYEISEEIKNKVEIIDKVMDRLGLMNSRTKDLVEYRYFQECSREQVMTRLGLSKKGFYRVRDRALECFARVLGYIN